MVNSYTKKLFYFFSNDLLCVNVFNRLLVLLIINNPPKATSESSICCNYPSYCIISYNQSLDNDRISSEFSNFDELKIITFVKSNFQQFPGVLARFSHLKSISANLCGLKTLDVSTFGGAESDNFSPNLKVIDLESNEITNIGAKAFVRLPHLTELNLIQNRITTIDDDAFYGLDELEVLALRNNSIVTLNVDIFSGLRSLQYIILDKNKLTTFNLDIFQHNKQLVGVHLTKNKMTDIQSTIVNENIKIMYLIENELFDISALNNMKAMKKLKISDNMNLQLHSQLFTDMPQLTRLDMDGTNLQRLKNDFSLFSSLRNLEVLAIGRNSLYNLVFTHFPNLPRLNEINLSDNGLTSIDVKRLKKKCPSLRKLTIGNNNWDCSYLTKLTNDMASLEIKFKHHIQYRFGEDKSIEITDDSTRSISGIGCNLQESSNFR
jgi:Leucine-rich repeat (LRR) protein